MPRPPFFADRTEKVVRFLRKLSEYSREKKTTISLSQMASRMVADFDLPPQDPKVRARHLREILKNPKNRDPDPGAGRARRWT